MRNLITDVAGVRVGHAHDESVASGVTVAVFDGQATVSASVQGGAPVQRNFPEYEMVRLANAPRVSVSFVTSDASIGGLGEPGVPPVAPAIANAVYALTGQRLRDLPLRLA